MQSPFNDKLAYSYPCKPSQTCIDYEDYDPCESNEDITEKDLAVLLKEEAAKLEREKEKAQATEAEIIKKTNPSSAVDDKSKLRSVVDDKSKQLTQIDDSDFKEEEEESGVKKKSCKYIKNPFFTNRLKLSTSHLPLPPPGPPPQNFPLAEDESSTKICLKKKKKCKKEDDKTKKPTYKATVDNREVIAKDEEAKEEDEDEESAKVYPSATADEILIENGTASASANASSIVRGAHEGKSKDHKKKTCKKRTDEMPTCKKKESEVSINFGPRKIPLQQKDLPQTSPKDIPEVEHQILMACGKNQQEDCKKKCKKRDKVK